MPTDLEQLAVVLGLDARILGTQRLKANAVVGQPRPLCIQGRRS